MSYKLKLIIGLVISILIAKYDLATIVLNYLPNFGMPFQLILVFGAWMLGWLGIIGFLIALILELIRNKENKSPTNSNSLISQNPNTTVNSINSNQNPPIASKKSTPKIVKYIVIIIFLGIVVPITASMIASIVNSDNPQETMGRLWESLILLSLMLVFPITALIFIVSIILFIIRTIRKSGQNNS